MSLFDYEKYKRDVDLTVRRLWDNRYNSNLRCFVANCRFQGKVFVACTANGILVDEHTTSNEVERTIFSESRYFIYEVTKKLIELRIDLKSIELRRRNYYE